MDTFIYLILGLLLVGWGYFAFRYPEDAIYLAEFWRFRNFEPSEHYIRYTRVCGVGSAVLGIGLVIFALIN